MRIVLFGQAAFGRDVLNALREAGEDVVAVSTPRPGSRPDPLFEAAGEAGLPVIETPALRQDGPFEQYLALKPELLVFAFVTDIVRKRVLEAATHGAIQYHPSLLPLHRGRTAMNWPIIAGEQTTGLTIFWVDEGIDTGPILLKREVELRPTDTVGTIYFDRLYPMGVEALVEATRMVREGTAPREAQDHSLGTYEAPCGPEHARIDWNHHGQVVFNLIRGCDPQPGASSVVRGTGVRLFDATFQPGAPSEAPGTVVSIVDSKAEIAAVGGTITVGRVQPEDGRKVAASEVLQAGDVLERPA
ncbi:MAG: methionyl-tRNA formyltransferase [Chloroflexi bacterium]|nr:methionyl-tRNA formyltransferase [Chloroflexota bacterium]MDA1001863.1 methionyl-tRNA formyltransferase [Chloroflexota bacterium]